MGNLTISNFEETSFPSFSSRSSSPLPTSIITTTTTSTTTSTTSTITNNLFPLHGCSIDGFNYFLELCLNYNKKKNKKKNEKNENFNNLTTTEICEKYLKLITIKRKESYCNYLKNINKTENMIGKATIFISHAWKYNFMDVINVIKSIDEVEKGHYFWFDLFSNNQHTTSNLPFEWWCTTFKSAIGDIGRVVMILMPWENPIPLTRAWCLWEIYCTAITKSRFEVRIPERENKLFLQAFLDDFDKINEMIARVDVKNSESLNPLDKERIFSAIMSTEGSFESLNSIVFEQLREWLVETAKLGVNESKQSIINDPFRMMNQLGLLLQGQGKLIEAEDSFRQSITGYESTVGRNDLLTQIPLHNLAGLLRAQGRFNEAEVIYRQSLISYREILGNESIHTLRVISNLSGLLQLQGSIIEAIELNKEALLGFRKVLGNNHLDTLTSMNNMGLLLQNEGKLNEAYPLFDEILSIRRELLGDSHPDTIHSIINLAVLFQLQGKINESTELFQESLSSCRSKLGLYHPDTLCSINNLATNYQSQQNYIEAEKLYLECLQLRRETLGNSHPSTINTINNLGTLYQLQNKLVEAELMLKESLEESIKVYGKTHQITLKVMNNLASLLQKQLKYDETEELFKEILQVRLEIFPSNHPDILESYNNLGGLYHTLERYNDAYHYYSLSYNGFCNIFGEGHQYSKIVEQNIEKLLEEKQRKQLAEEEIEIVYEFK